MSDSRTVFFDLDGTLVDHFRVLHRCYQYALRKMGQPVPSLDEVRRSVGGSMEVTMRRFVPEDRVAEAATLWREHFSEIFLDDIELMAGGRELIVALYNEGCQLAVISNKIGEHSRAICQHLGLDPYLKLVLGAGDTAFRKPMREFSERALNTLAADPTHSCVIGDSPFDIAAAHVVGMRAWCVTTGSHTAPQLREAGADGIFSNLSELATTVFGITL